MTIYRNRLQLAAALTTGSVPPQLAFCRIGVSTAAAPAIRLLIFLL